MSLWTRTSAPKWADSVRTPLGWQHAQTGEILVAFGDTTYTLPSTPAIITSIKLDRNRKRFKTGDVIKALVLFNEPVIVNVSGGVPTLPLVIGSNTRNLVFTAQIDDVDRAKSVAELAFEYTVVSGDSATATNVNMGVAAVAASLGVFTGSSGIRYTAKAAGTGGNSITITYAVAGNNTTLTVSVTSNAITVNLATGAGGAATSTASQVLAAVNASTPAAALVSLALIGDGTGVPTAESVTNLTGGTATTGSTLVLNSGTIKDVSDGTTNVTLTFSAPNLTAVTVN